MSVLGRLFGKARPKIESHVDYIDDLEVVGWIWLPDTPIERVVVEALLDGKIVGEAIADGFRQDLLDAGKGDGHHGFSIELPLNANDKEKNTLELRVQRDLRTFYFNEVNKNVGRIHGSSQHLDFFVESVDRHGVSGWIWQPSSPKTRLVVELISEGRVIGEGVADRFRHDLMDAGKSDGRCSFQIEIPPKLLDGRAHDLSLRVKGLEASFKELPRKRFASARCEVDRFSPFEVSGSCWVPEAPQAEMTVRLLLNGIEMLRKQTDAVNNFSFSVGASELRPAMSEVAPGDCAEIDYAIDANGVEVHRQKFHLSMSESGRYAIYVKVFSAVEFLADVISLEASPGGTLRLDVDGEAVGTWVDFSDHARCIDPGVLSAVEGDRRVEIVSIDSAGSERSEFSEHFNHDRWNVLCDITNDRVEGTVIDRRGHASELAIELLVDNQPAGITTARRSMAAEDDAFGFTFPIAGRFRDGKPHLVNVRIVGTNTFWPLRGIMFQAGTVADNVVARVLDLGDGRVAGHAFLPWAPAEILLVELRSNERILARGRADRFSPTLAVESVLPVDRGFQFSIANSDEIDLRVCGYLGDEMVFDMPVQRVVSKPFQLSTPACGLEGICFVVRDPYSGMEHLEDTRTMLLTAAEVARTSSLQVTIVLADGVRTLDRQCSVRDELVGLIGQVNAESLAQARFVRLPEPILESTITDVQAVPYRLELWIRSCQFSLVVGPSRGGVMSYCAQSRREGLLDNTSVGVLVGGFTIEDVLGDENLLDDPAMLNAEALERLALRHADHVWATQEQVAASVSCVLPEAAERCTVHALNLGDIAPSPLGRPRNEAERWIVAAGPLTTSAGLTRFCDALDRLARRTDREGDRLGVAFLGPEGTIQSTKAATYIRRRAKNWPFTLAVHVDLSFDSMCEVAADFCGRGCGIVFGGSDNAAWSGVLEKSGVGVAFGLVLKDSPVRIAEWLQETLRAGESPTTITQHRQSLGARINEVAAEMEIPSRAVASRDDSDIGEVELSVCITHFNRPSLLRQTLQSLRSCAWPRIETIVVDDGSANFGVDDELEEISKDFADLSVKVIRQDNSYLGAARNTAARHASGEFIVFMDDDNIAHPEMLRGFVAAQRATEADLVTARFAFFEETDPIGDGKTVPLKLGVPLAPDLAVGVFSNGFGDANMMIRRSAFERVGGFTEEYGVGHEDWEFFAKASMLGLRHCLSNRVLFYYRVGAQSMLRGRDRVERDLLRNIRAYSTNQRPELYRIAQLAQGLVNRWDRPAGARPQRIRTGLTTAKRLAFGRVAVIMRTKNRPVLLARAIDSVLGQTYTDWTLVIVNDGGDPAPVRALLNERRAALQGRELLINNPHSTGMENASNAGITSSASEFVVIHDDDDAWHPEFLQRCVAHLDSTAPEVGGVITHATVVIEDIEGDNVVERNRFLFKDLEAVELAKLAIENQFPPICFLFRRSAMEVVGLFDGELPVLGDWDFHLRIAQSYRLDVVREPLAFYHHRTAGTANQYGNTVVAQRDVHRIQRAHYVNRKIREGLRAKKDDDTGQMLYLGELYRDLNGSLQDVRKHLHWLEERLNER